MASTKKYLDYEGLTSYDSKIKKYMEKYETTYADDSDIDEMMDDEVKVINVKSLKYFRDLIYKKIPYTVEDGNPIVEIGEEKKTLATTEYVDDKLSWQKTL